MEGEAKEDLVHCSHCKKEVAKVNLPMHEVHCQRFLCLCPCCDELVPKEQLEEHKVEEHTQVRCQKCNMKMQRCKLPDHKTDECTERPVSCEFCELELPLSSLEEHTVTCGSRTERCPDCRQYVTLKDRTKHAEICSSALPEDKRDNEKKSIYKATKPEPANNFWDDLECLYQATNTESDEAGEDPGVSFSFQAHQKHKWGGAVGFEDLDQIRTCPTCHLALPLQTLQWHEKKCAIFESLKLVN